MGDIPLRKSFNVVILSICADGSFSSFIFQSCCIGKLYSEVLSEYVEKSGGLEKVKFEMDDHW